MFLGLREYSSQLRIIIIHEINLLLKGYFLLGKLKNANIFITHTLFNSCGPTLQNNGGNVTTTAALSSSKTGKMCKEAGTHCVISTRWLSFPLAIKSTYKSRLQVMHPSAALACLEVGLGARIRIFNLGYEVSWL